MGRAYEVRKASIQKTGAARGKIYTTFAKEIYLAAKKGIPDPDSNIVLKRIIEKAKKNEVPSDIINRAIDKAKGMGQDEYEVVTYEGFGPGASTLIIKCLTDNVNRTVGFVRAAFNKVHKSLGVTNSVAYNYDYLGVVSFKYDNEEEIFDKLLDAGINQPAVFSQILIKPLLRKASNKLEYPNFNGVRSAQDYQILNIQNAFVYNPSVLIGLASISVEKQLEKPSTFKKKAPGFMDPFFRK